MPTFAVPAEAEPIPEFEAEEPLDCAALALPALGPPRAGALPPVTPELAEAAELDGFPGEFEPLELLCDPPAAPVVCDDTAAVAEKLAPCCVAAASAAAAAAAAVDTAALRGIPGLIDGAPCTPDTLIRPRDPTLAR